MVIPVNICSESSIISVVRASEFQRRLSMRTRTINTIKKAVVLFIALCVAFAMAAPVYGANNGPNKGKDAYSYVQVKTPSKSYTVYCYDSKVKTLAPKGIKYNKKTNTMIKKITYYKDEEMICKIYFLGILIYTAVNRC